jgi:hypothetical protein
VRHGKPGHVNDVQKPDPGLDQGRDLRRTSGLELLVRLDFVGQKNEGAAFY